jgi:2-phospho-L-lactate guanylyltransferase (CobY/MobA/RfbA family)
MKAAPVCILPVRGLDEGKSRLSGVIDGQTRADLNAFLLETTLDVLEDYPGAASVIVVSASDDVHARARWRRAGAARSPSREADRRE